MTSLFTSHNYSCKVILDKPANSGVTFMVPFNLTSGGIVTSEVNKLTVVLGGYSDEAQFSQKGSSYNIGLSPGDMLKFMKGTDDRTYYEVIWDGQFVDTLPTAPDETPDPPSN